MVVEVHDEGRLTVESADVEITHYLWIDWTRIAQGQFGQARAAREGARTARTAGEDIAPHLEVEYFASMVAISACAHALDALYGGLITLMAIPAVAETRHGNIRDALGKAFVLRNEDSKQWKDEFTWLFNVRDAALHWREASRPVVAHPLQVMVSANLETYRLEAALRAHRLLRDVLLVAVSSTRARNDAICTYFEQKRVTIDQMLAASV